MTTHDDVDSLSPKGRSRRDAMLADMLRLVDVTRARRRRRRQAASAATMLLLALALFRVARFAGPDEPGLAIRGPSHEGSTAVVVGRVADSGVRLTELVHDDATSVERLRADAPRRIIWLDDESLLSELASMNRPAGLLRHNGETRLTVAVTDEELGRTHY